MTPQDQTKKEALFNEVKGSLFEFMMGRKLSQLAGEELKFIEGLDKNYLNVLSQQDRMVRQFYPEMLTFLSQMTEDSSRALINFLKETPHDPQLRGKFVNSSLADEIHEADLILQSSRGTLPLSLKLNRKNSYVNTKSGGIKSFFLNYFSFIPQNHQQEFNLLVDQEFSRMSYELHALNDMEFLGDYDSWIKLGKSELPGELSTDERQILKDFYARLAKEMHRILSLGCAQDPEAFRKALPALMGFSHREILQLICFHDFKNHRESSVSIHAFGDVECYLNELVIEPFTQTSSVELSLGPWLLQIRIKPMNKFTTTAIKINCSVKFKLLDDA
jgi:hypothetical protein